MSDTERNPTLFEQMDELNQNVRELRDEVLLKPFATCLNKIGVETADIDAQSEDVSLFRDAGAVLSGPVLANLGVFFGFYAGLTQSLESAVVVGVAVGLLAGAFGLLFGYRYFETGT